MDINYLQEDDYNAFLAFDKKVYPNRSNRDFLYRHYYCNKISKEENKYNILVAKQNGMIIGQIKFLLNNFMLNGKSFSGAFGTDLIVEEKFRSTLAGIYLTIKIKNLFKYYFGMGANEKATLLIKSLNFNKIGDIDKYFWIRKYHKIVKYSKKKNVFSKIKDLPLAIDTYKIIFKKVDIIPDDNYSLINDNILHFNRDYSFLKWRLDNKNNYNTYISGNEKNFMLFSIRILNWRGLNLIVVIDYRTKYLNNNSFVEIVTAVKILAKITNVDGVMFPSSLSFYDNILKSNKFKKIGNPTNILSSYNFNYRDEDIAKRNVVFVTFADSDSFLLV
jgi:hypothetical protein